MSVIVYYLAKIPGLPRESLFRDVFSGDIFEFIVLNIPGSSLYVDNPTMSGKHAQSCDALLTALSKSREQDTESYCIVIKDTSTTNVDSVTMESLVKSAINLKKWDLTYLCRWLDRCDLYKEDLLPITRLTSIYKSTSPNGTQCIMFSPEGRDKILGFEKLPNGSYFLPLNQSLDSSLNSCIEEGQLTANVFSPNIIEFDIADRDSVSDLAKLSDCRRPEPENATGPLPMIIFIVIVVGVILLVWAVKNVGPDTSSVTHFNK